MRPDLWSTFFPLTLLPLLVSADTNYPQTLSNPLEVPESTRKSWCDKQKTSCVFICQSTPQENACFEDSLTYTCACPVSDTVPNYRDTLPWLICDYLRHHCSGTGCSQYCGPQNSVPTSIMSGNSLENSPPTGANGVPPTTTPSANPPALSFTPHSSGSQNPPAGSGESTTTNLLFSTPTPTSTFTETSSAATAGSAVTASSSPIAASSHKGGLSTGAKAGIAVGAIVGFALLLLLAFFLLKSRKKKQQAPLLADEGKSLGVGPSTMSHQDPYSDTPEHAPVQNRFSWAQPATAMTAVPPTSQSQHYSSGQPTSRDISNEEAAAGGYWQPSASHSPVSAQARKPSDVTAHSRTSMQEARAPPSPVGQSSYTAYNPARQSVAAAPASRNSQRLMDDDWDEDEARLDAEIAEIERMKQMREERAAMR